MGDIEEEERNYMCKVGRSIIYKNHETPYS